MTIARTSSDIRERCCNSASTAASPDPPECAQARPGRRVVLFSLGYAQRLSVARRQFGTLEHVRIERGAKALGDGLRLLNAQLRNRHCARRPQTGRAS